MQSNCPWINNYGDIVSCASRLQMRLLVGTFVCHVSREKITKWEVKNKKQISLLTWEGFSPKTFSKYRYLNCFSLNQFDYWLALPVVEGGSFRINWCNYLNYGLVNVIGIAVRCEKQIIVTLNLIKWFFVFLIFPYLLFAFSSGR